VEIGIFRWTEQKEEVKMNNREISWKFQVTEKFSPLKTAKRHGIFAFAVIFLPSFCAILGHLFKSPTIAIMPLSRAIPIVVGASLGLVWALKFYLRTHIVTLDERGITYWSKQVIPWSAMVKMSLSIEGGHPYLFIDELQEGRNPRYIPLYLEDINLFKKKLMDLVPIGHPIRELYIDIDDVTKRYDKDESLL
jgi:hypothetical protein